MTPGSDESDEDSTDQPPTDGSGRERAPAESRQFDREPAEPERDGEKPADRDESEQPPAHADEEWRYSVSEVGKAEDEDGEEGNVAGLLMRNQPLEPGDISPENAFFFLVGSLGTIAFIVLAVMGI